MPTEAFERFSQLVYRDPDLRHRLRHARDHDDFVELVVTLGHARSCEVTPDDVESAMRANRRAWIERWL